MLLVTASLMTRTRSSACADRRAAVPRPSGSDATVQARRVVDATGASRLEYESGDHDTVAGGDRVASLARPEIYLHGSVVIRRPRRRSARRGRRLPRAPCRAWAARTSSTIRRALNRRSDLISSGLGGAGSPYARGRYCG